MATNPDGGLGERRGPLILGSQLRRARETVRFPLERVAKHLEIDQEEIVAWEEQRAKPNLRQLEALAELYGRDIDYFLKETPSPPVQVEFRSVTRRSYGELSEEARLVIARFDELCRADLELDRMLGRTRDVELRRVSDTYSPVKLAKDQRSYLGFGERPIRNLRRYLTGQGIRIFEISVPQGEFSGFSHCHSDYGPCILINASDVSGRRNFTLAHEYCHLLYGDAPSVCDIPQERKRSPTSEERKGNIFAVEFLLPADPVREDFLRRGLSKTPSTKEAGLMANKWQVSLQAMLYRLEDLGRVVRGHAEALLAPYKPRPWYRRGKRPPWQRRLGEPFVSNASTAYNEGQISLGKLASYLGQPLRKALETAEQHKKKG